MCINHYSGAVPVPIINMQASSCRQNSCITPMKCCCYMDPCLFSPIDHSPASKCIRCIYTCVFVCPGTIQSEKTCLRPGKGGLIVVRSSLTKGRIGVTQHSNCDGVNIEHTHWTAARWAKLANGSVKRTASLKMQWLALLSLSNKALVNQRDPQFILLQSIVSSS